MASCDRCGREAHVAELVKERRPAGDLHVHPKCAQAGGVVEQVARDRAVHAGGPKAVEVPRR